MIFEDGDLIEENEQYSFVLFDDRRVLLFSWKHIKGLVVENFQQAIARFAAECAARRPVHAVIDAVALDQGSPAVAWLRGHHRDNHIEDYHTWWSREILPLYHDAGIVTLAVGTGDPGAPGELSDTPSEVKFKIGYFSSCESAMQWKPE